VKLLKVIKVTFCIQTFVVYSSVLLSIIPKKSIKMIVILHQLRTP